MLYKQLISLLRPCYVVCNFHTFLSVADGYSKWGKHWAAVFQESSFIVYSVLACQSRHRSFWSSENQCRTRNQHTSFPVRYCTSSPKRETTAKPNIFVLSIIQASLLAWLASRSYISFFATIFLCLHNFRLYHFLGCRSPLYMPPLWCCVALFPGFPTGMGKAGPPSHPGAEACEDKSRCCGISYIVRVTHPGLCWNYAKPSNGWSVLLPWL